MPATPSHDPGSDADDIVSIRVFDAPREAVFCAFIEPGLLAQWWGPNGFTNTFHAFDPRPGGAWRFTMRGPDGAEYAMNKRFVEIVPAERIVIQHLEPEHHRFRMTMTFEDAPVSGKATLGTRVTWRMRFEVPEEAQRVRAIVVAANEENFDRLQALLARAV